MKRSTKVRKEEDEHEEHDDDKDDDEEVEVEVERNNIKRKDIIHHFEEDELLFVNNKNDDQENNNNNNYENHDTEEQMMIMNKKCKHNNNNQYKINGLKNEDEKSKSRRHKYSHCYNNNVDDDDYEDDDEHDEVISLAEEQPPCEYHDDENRTENDNPNNDNERNNEEDCVEDNNMNNNNNNNSSRSQQQLSHQAYQHNQYYYQQQQQQLMIPTSMLTPPTTSSSSYPFYASNNTNISTLQYFPPSQQQQQPQPQPPMAHALFYPSSQPPTLPPPPQFQPYQFPTHLPMPLSPVFSLNEHSPNNINTANYNNNNGQQSSLFQEVQYYESKMRDHAAAYATAAASAAFAAAQIATAAGNTATIHTTHHNDNNYHHQQQHRHHPQSNNHNHDIIFKSDNGIKKQKRSNHGNMMNSKNMNSNNTNSRYQRNKKVMHSQKQFQYQQSHHQSMNHYQQNKRSRYNTNYQNQNQSGNYQQNSYSKKYFKKKRTLGLETLYGKNGVSALFELCSKQNWPPPKFMLVSSGNNTISSHVVNNSNHSDNSRKEVHKNAYAKSSEDIGNDIDSTNVDDLGVVGADDSTSNQVTLSDSNNNQIHHILSEDQITKIDSKHDPNKGVSVASVGGVSSCLDFVISVSINGEEFGRGRGGSKKSAQQDAARKTLELLYPGIIFDTNGILIDLGLEIDDNEISGEEDLNLTNLASKLAIDGEAQGKDSGLTVEGKRSRRGSPTPSEDSSISTTVSMSKNIVKPLMTGGPFKQPGAPGRIRSIYPCASSVSSATSEDDDDEYFASRGAHICSVLLHAMAQIDERIREPPSYTFDVCATTMTPQHQQEGKSSTKRKGGVVNAIASKRRSATTDVGRVVTIHRCSFACTASLILYHKIEKKIQHNIDDDNKSHHSTSQKEQEEKRYLNSDEIKENGKQVLSETNKDSTASPSKKTNSIVSPSKCDSLINAVEKESQEIASEREDGDGSNPSRSESNNEGCKALSKQTSQNKPRSEKVKSTAAKKDSQEEEFKTEKLEAMATGASKRDAKHIASAKLLALLFPECKGMVEVVKSAEAARERYAENKALKQSMKATTFAYEYTKRKKIKCEENKNDLDSESEILQLEKNVNESAKPLQSVKEEDGEDNEEPEIEDQLCHKRLKLK